MTSEYNMKYIVALLVLFPTLSYSKDCSTVSRQEEVTETIVINKDVPSHLKGAKIIVELANGQRSEVPAEQFKVVPRKQERLISRVKDRITETCIESKNSLNRVMILGGYGAKEGIDRTNKTTSTKLESNVGVVGGLQYQRLLNEQISVGVQGQTNQTGSLMIGLDF